MPSVALWLAVVVSGQIAAGPPAAEPPLLPHCLVTVIEDIEVPAQEAGVLTSVRGREGLQVEKDALLAQVDDSLAQSQQRVALFEHEAATAKAASDINVRFSRAATKVAEAEYLKALEAVRKVPGSISQAELNRLQLTHHRSELEIEQAQLDLTVAALTAKTRGAEVEATENNIQRRKITAPFEGVIVAVNRRAGEWVQPGETVLRLLRMNRLRVEGFLNSARYSPDQISRKPVEVEVILAQGRAERFTGVVSFVSPLVEAGGDYRVWAEVDNRQENGEWVLRPGAKVQMLINTSARSIAEQPRSSGVE